MKYCNTKDLPGPERLRQLFVYDFETGYLSNRISRKNQAAGARSGTIDHRGYRRTYVEGATYAEHRIIWVWANNLNSVNSARSQTGYRGVSHISSSGKYRAQIKHQGHNQHLGMFNTALEAFHAYSLARAKTINQLSNRNHYA